METQMQRQIDHAAADAAHAKMLLGTINEALRLSQPNVALRPGFDRDFGSYTAHPMDPRTPEPGDDELSEDDARELATDQVLATPETMANWLAFECSRESKPVDMRAVTEYALLEASAPTLMAVLMGGDDKQAMRALHRLRELATEQNEDQIASRTAALLRTNATALGL